MVNIHDTTLGLIVKHDYQNDECLVATIREVRPIFSRNNVQIHQLRKDSSKNSKVMVGKSLIVNGEYYRHSNPVLWVSIGRYCSSRHVVLVIPPLKYWRSCTSLFLALLSLVLATMDLTQRLKAKIELYIEKIPLH